MSSISAGAGPAGFFNFGNIFGGFPTQPPVGGGFGGGFGGFPNNPLSAKDSNLLRMIAHDMYDGGIDGSLPVKLLVQNRFGVDLGESDILRNANSIPNASDLLRADLQDDGIVNGSNAAGQMARIYQQATGIDISGGMRFAQTRPATLQSILSRSPDPTTPQGWNQVMQANNWNPASFFAASAWGHDLIPSPIDDGRLNGSYLRNPSLDTKIIQGLNLQPTINGWVQQDQQRFGQLNGVALDNAFLGSLERAFRLPGNILGRI